MNRLQRALDVLASLGQPAERPRYERPKPPALSYSACKLCGAPNIVWANTPHGGRVPLDRHPEGDLVIVDGTAVDYGPAHAGRNRWVRHFAACRQAQKQQRRTS